MSKRSNGEGTVRQRPNGGWEARIVYEDPDTGERVRKSFYGATQREVRAKMKAARARVDAGRPAVDAKVTVEAWAAQWVSTALAASSRRASTKDLSASLLRAHVTGTKLGRISLDRLRPSDVDAWMLSLREPRKVTGKDGKDRTKPGLAATSIARTLRVLRVCLDGAMRDGLIARNVAREVQVPREQMREARTLTPGEVGAILEAAKGTRFARLFAVIAATGLRKGEALALRWEDLDWGVGTVTVRGTLTRAGGEWVVSDPKTAGSRRVLTPDAAVMALLREQRRTQLEERIRAANVWEDSGHVFTTETGHPMDPRNVLRAFTTACEKAGVEGATVHTLRHAAASLMIAGGADVVSVSKVLGHSRTSTTLNIYAHSASEAQAAALGSLGRVLGL